MVGSSLARMQQVLLAGLLVAAAAWATSWWPAQPVVAVVGATCIVFVHAIVLALEFMLLVPASKHDPSPRPSAGELVAAWWREVVQDVRVFAGRQPFAWRRCPDRLVAAPGALGIVFIHGFVCNRGFWLPWLERAQAQGHPFVALNLEPVSGSIDGYAPTIDDAVRRVTAASGRAPMLVCHSMGGLAARAWLRQFQAESRVAHVVTIASPHQGTWLARFGRAANSRQMRIGGDWLGELATAEHSVGHRFTCWYSNCDNVVFPPITATLPGADNRLLRGAAHVDLAFRAEVMDHAFALARKL
jgi:pimeloyl-ACP methyl ester carboxylesterase